MLLTLEHTGYTLWSLETRWKIAVPRLEPAIIATRPATPLGLPTVVASATPGSLPRSRLRVPSSSSSAPAIPRESAIRRVHDLVIRSRPSRRHSPIRPAPPGDPVRSSSPGGRSRGFYLCPWRSRFGAPGINPPAGSRRFIPAPPKPSHAGSRRLNP